uniref:WD_REPEATS_REGION domain-containing protein n=1 Tax=Elaeophora elaphi TaxID=1147741 RepID=A0A0R3RI28_9BILA
MNGHTEHRSGKWNRQELYRSTMQALEGRCSTRSNLAKEFEMQIREFTATKLKSYSDLKTDTWFQFQLECHLVDLLRKHLEELNEPDRLLISRLNRALCELGDSNSSVLSRPLYHMLSPTRPAHRVWNMCTKDPERLKNLVSEVCHMANITCENGDEQNSCQIKFSAALPSAWSAADCAKYLIEKQEVAEDVLSERRARHFGSYRSMKNGFSLMKSASLTLERVTSSLPTLVSSDTPANRLKNGSSIDSRPFSELAKEKSNLDKISERQLSTEDGRTQIPLEPNVFVRKMRQQSFRESSLTDESDSACALKEETFNSTSPSATSSIPVCQTDNSCDSRDLQAPLFEQTVSSCDPSTSTTLTVGNSSKEPNFMRFGERFFSRPIDIISLPNIFTKKQLLAVSDSCGGVYIVTSKGEILQHLPTRDSSASSLTVDPTSWRLLVSVMHSKGRSIHAFDIANRFKKVEVIPCPREPKIELSRTRWITVSPRGELFAVSGDNHRSAIWMYNQARKGWKILKESRKTRYQYLRVAEDQAEYKAVVLLTCDAAQNRILLFVADHTGTLINEYDLTKTYKLYECIKNPASAIVDSLGNLLVLDYATSRLWALLGSTKGMRHIKEIVIPSPLGPQEALGIAAHGDWIYMTCFARREVICVRYLVNGVLTLSCTTTSETPKSDRRAISLPRPTRKPNQV